MIQMQSRLEAADNTGAKAVMRNEAPGRAVTKLGEGAQVLVLAGRDQGKRGAVMQGVEEKRSVVEGVNVVKKHVRPNPMKGTTGGAVDKPLSIHQSNVAIFNAATGKADRVGIKLLADAKTNKTTKVRVFKSSGEEIKA